MCSWNSINAFGSAGWRVWLLDIFTLLKHGAKHFRGYSQQIICFCSDLSWPSSASSGRGNMLYIYTRRHKATSTQRCCLFFADFTDESFATLIPRASKRHAVDENEKRKQNRARFIRPCVSRFVDSGSLQWLCLVTKGDCHDHRETKHTNMLQAKQREKMKKWFLIAEKRVLFSSYSKPPARHQQLLGSFSRKLKVAF